MTYSDIWMRIVPSLGLLAVAIVLYYFAVRNHLRVKKIEGLYERLEKRSFDLSMQVFNAAALLPQQTRYEISLTDWGPDFTGEDGTLPRWRWVVKDADYYVRGALLTPQEPADTDILMLGNEHMASSAVLAALEWVEQQRHPEQKVTSVVVGEVEPYRA